MVNKNLLPRFVDQGKKKRKTFPYNRKSKLAHSWEVETQKQMKI